MCQMLFNEIVNILENFKKEFIDFHVYKEWLRGKSESLKQCINLKWDLIMIIDNWFEYIEFCYLEEDWKKYGLEVGEFIIESMQVFPKQAELPENSDIVRDQFYRYLK